MPRSELLNPRAVLLLAGGAAAAGGALALAGAPAPAVAVGSAIAVAVPVGLAAAASAATVDRTPERGGPAEHAAPPPDLGPEPSADRPRDAIDEFLDHVEGRTAAPSPLVVREAPPIEGRTGWMAPAVVPHPRPAPPPAPSTEPHHVAAQTDIYRRALTQCRLAFRRHPVPSLAFDHAGGLTMMNDAAREMLGVTASPGADLHWQEVLPLPDVDGIPLTADRHPLARVLAGRESRPVPWTPPGSRVEVTVTAVALTSRHDEPLGALVTLHRSGGHEPISPLDRLVWARPEPALVIDADGTIRGWNAAAERQLLYMRHEVVGRGVDVLSPPGARAGRTRLEDLDAESGPRHGRVVVTAADDGDREFVVVCNPPDAGDLLAVGADRRSYDGHLVCVLYPLDVAGEV